MCYTARLLTVFAPTRMYCYPLNNMLIMSRKPNDLIPSERSKAARFAYDAVLKYASTPCQLLNQKLAVRACIFQHRSQVTNQMITVALAHCSAQTDMHCLRLLIWVHTPICNVS
jgi:hypothetical protein